MPYDIGIFRILSKAGNNPRFSMIARLLLLFIAVSALQASAQSTFVVETWDGISEEEVQVDSAGALILGNVDSETNLALKRPAFDHSGDQVKVTDGKTDKRSVWNTLTSSVFNFFVQIDLDEPRLIDRVVVVSPDGNDTDFMKGYSIQTSIDNIVFSEQILNTRNLESRIDTTFTPVVARYVRVQIKAIDRVHDVQVAEVEVYGGGFLSAGILTADVTDLGVATPKNFGKIRWTADIPEGTKLTMQFRTGPTSSPNDSWSDWTEAVDENGGVLLKLPEPRRYFQYQATLTTEDPGVSPRLTGFEMDFGTPVADMVTGEVVRDDSEVAVTDTLPNDEVPVGVVRSFLFNLQADIGSGSGFESVNLEFPNRVQVEKVLLDGTVLARGSDYSLAGDGRTVTIRFTDRIETDVAIQVEFSTVLFDEFNSFTGSVVDLAFPDNPQQIEASGSRDDALGVFGVGLIDGVFDKDRLEVAPNPFSPNGDGRFDVVQFKYELAKISIPRPVTLRVFDLTGRSVRRIDLMQKSGSHLVEWDGRDDDGDVVSPGLYLFQVDVDSGEEVSFNGAVGVSY